MNWPVVHPHVAAIAEAVDSAETGTVRTVDCGRFIPATFRKRGPAIRYVWLFSMYRLD